MLELKEIGLRVASLRETCGISSAEMAEKIGLCEGTAVAAGTFMAIFGVF